jgi:hypothetical protein
MRHDRHVLVPAAALAALTWSVDAGLAQQPQPKAACAGKLIGGANGLLEINNNLAGSYCLANDIDLSTVPNFPPILGPFTGKFFGNNYEIRNLTIDQPAMTTVGLFQGLSDFAVVQDLRLVNVNVTGGFNTGALAGVVLGGVTIKNVHVSGQVTCATADCAAGGIAGFLEGCLCDFPELTESSSSAAVSATGLAGGAVGYALDAFISRFIATGAISCLAGGTCAAGGLVGVAEDSFVDRSAATGAVSVLLSDPGYAGGLIGWLDGFFGFAQYSSAFGPVSGNATTATGGLIGRLRDALIDQTFSVGRVSGAGTVDGLIGRKNNGSLVSSSYFDADTSGQSGKRGKSTNELQGGLRSGFDDTWAITSRSSYPFVNDPDIVFNPALATLVNGRSFSFDPISQLDTSQYATAPAHADAASLATVYAMIARGIGRTRDDAALANAKISDFWDDGTQTATWQGPVTAFATLGAVTPLPAGVPINRDNVILEMSNKNLVILRGTVMNGGVPTTHWMLGTLFTRDGDGLPATVVAHDPWSGKQVTIRRKTKMVVAPADFPLTGFKIDAYQPVTVLAP